MNRRLICGVFFVASAVVAFGQEKRPNPATDKHQSESTKQIPQPSPSVVVIRDEHTENHGDRTGKDTKTYFQRFASAENLPSILLVVVAGLTLWYIAKQAKESAKATQAMRDSLPLQKSAADAALLNSQIALGTMRPWIVIFVLQSDKSRVATFRAGNMGQTPAVVLGFQTGSKCLSVTQVLPPEPEFGEVKMPSIPVLMPGKERGDQDIELLSQEQFVEIAAPCAQQSSRQSLQENATSRKVSYFYFKVTYALAGAQSSESKIRFETRMCFRFDPTDAGDSLIPYGGEKYNRHT